MSRQDKQKSVLVAQYFLDKSMKSSRHDLTNKKLQKLLFYAQAWSMVVNNKKLFNDKFEAWIHGAAIPAIYRKYKTFGFNPISESVDENDFQALTDIEKSLLDEVWNIYGKYDADYLELLNHSEEPWQNARKNLSPFESSSSAISESGMKSYYGKKLQETKA